MSPGPTSYCSTGESGAKFKALTRVRPRFEKIGTNLGGDSGGFPPLPPVLFQFLERTQEEPTWVGEHSCLRTFIRYNTIIQLVVPLS